MTTAFRILTVCTGNICRSPMAERVLRAQLADADVEVTSAGTHGLVGEPMTPQSAALVSRHGGDPQGFVARGLEPALVAGADLVLALAREHRAHVVRAHPRASRYTFTVRELARLTPRVTPLPGETTRQRLQALVPAAAAQRGFVPVADPADDDIPDPYQRPQEAYEQMAALLVPALAAVVAAVRRD